MWNKTLKTFQNYFKKKLFHVWPRHKNCKITFHIMHDARLHFSRRQATREQDPKTRFFTPPRYGSGVLRSVCLSVYVSVCVSVCLFASISLKPRQKIFTNFCAGPLWPWLGSPLAALLYVMYFRFYGWRHVWLKLNGPYGDAWKAEPLTYYH